jgi:hypothetical protein
MSTTHIHLSRRYRKAIAGAAATLALGGLIAGCGSSSSTTTTTAAPAAATSGSAARGPGARAFGKPVTGATATKAKAAALAKYPGTAERVMQLSDGSYVVHVLQGSSGEVHVKVSKAFAVTGTEQGPPGAGAPPAASGTTA